MRVAIVGMGYVGAVTAACFASRNHSVIGVDLSDAKVAEINSGIPPVREDGLDRLIRDSVANGRLRATTDIREAWATSEVLIVSVGTPSAPSGDSDLSAVQSVVHELGVLLRETRERKVIVITSTVPPGTLINLVKPMLEELSGKTAGVEFGLCFSPEFLREGSAVRDFTEPERVIIGASDSESVLTLRHLFGVFTENIVVTSPEVAESVKFAANAWHGLKVAFANEIARISSLTDVNSQEVMNLFVQDKKLNISERYLRPGFAFGGSCLPKDLRTLTYRARLGGARVPVLEGVLASNEEHFAFALRRVEEFSPRRILVLGLAFKAGTDDLRESPAVPLVEALLGRGYKVDVFDNEIQLDKLLGANRRYVTQRLPHIVDILVSRETAFTSQYDLIVIAQPNRAFAKIMGQLQADSRVLDLSGMHTADETTAEYAGLAW